MAGSWSRQAVMRMSLERVAQPSGVMPLRMYENEVSRAGLESVDRIPANDVAVDSDGRDTHTEVRFNACCIDHGHDKHSTDTLRYGYATLHYATDTYATLRSHAQ